MKKKMTQEELSSLLGITRTSLVNIEQGRQHPNLYLIFEIAHHLGIEYSQLLPSKEEFVNNYTGIKPQIVISVSSLTQAKPIDADVSEEVENFVHNAMKKANETGDNKG